MNREQFRKRLRAYVLIKFGKSGDDLSPAEEKVTKKLVGQIMYACYNVEETGCLEALQMRDNNGLAFYIRQIWEFQRVVDARMEAVLNEKEVRAFSLFPMSTALRTAHIVINGTTLAGFVSRIRERGEGNLMEDWNIRFLDHPLALSDGLVPADDSRSEVQPRQHLFANEIKTDGYNASILYYQPKQDELERGEDDPLVPAGYLPDVIIGLDSGMRSVCTAAHQYLRPQAPRRRKQRRVRRPRRQKKKKRKRNFPKWIRRPKALRLGQRPGREIVSVTAREYRHLAGFNRFRAWNESQKRKFFEYKKMVDGMPSFKTASYKQYLKRLEYFWQHAAYLLQFCKDRPYLK
ncbi:hypothetical protein L914_20913 [Phytophthora nicotianae]|uniref:Uncharacterized protein n=4 Tax=Phytophthora nicotianae TaxID=4792 RepID=W2M549_PHYNI|nr:hypothetical protein L914_20913 [Phytophthora nicotianae]